MAAALINQTATSPPQDLLGGDENLLMPKQDKTELYVVMGYLSFLSVMGTGGNALVLYVFSQKKDKLVSTLFIIVLAFVDFTTCLIVIPYTIYMEYHDFFIDYDFLCKAYQFFITSNIPFSALIMVAIAIDRYFCICHPFLHAMNVRRAKVMITCLGIFAVTLAVVVALMYGVYDVVDHEVVIPAGNQSYVTSGGQNVSTEATVESVKALQGGGHYNVLDPADAVHSNVTTSTATPPPQVKIVRKVIFTGHCGDNQIVWSTQFAWYYQKFFMSLYIVCLAIVIVLYTLIYRSVLARRTKRQKQKSKSLPMVLSTQATADRNGDSGVTTEETLLTSVNGDSKVETVTVKNGPTAARSKDTTSSSKPSRKSTKRGDRHRMANLKTAAMLFVVTVVFIVTFMPAFLMALQLITYSMTVFYLYFANNVANPIIYSFMNKNFRDDLRKLFCRAHSNVSSMYSGK